MVISVLTSSGVNRSVYDIIMILEKISGLPVALECTV